MLEETDNILEDTEAELRRAVAKKALQKGAALERLCWRIRKNSVTGNLLRFATMRLKANAFGEGNHTIGEEQIGTFRFNRDQLRLLRQEQLMLMAENERLLLELRSIRDSRPHFYGQVDKELASTRGTVIRESKLAKAIDQTISGKLEIQSMKIRLMLLVRTFSRLRLRVLGNAFRALYRNPRIHRQIRNRYSHAKTSHIVRSASIILEYVLRAKIAQEREYALAKLLVSTRANKTLERFGYTANDFLPTLPNYANIPTDINGLIAARHVPGYQRQLPSVKRHFAALR